MSKKSPRQDREMEPEYDFTGGVRGKFYRKNAVLIPPVHLEPDVLKYLQARAHARGVTLSELVNDLLKKHIDLIETVS